MKSWKIKINFNRKILGSQPSSEQVRRDYISKKMTTGRTGTSAEIAMAQIENEIENYNKSETKFDNIEGPLTVFHRDEDGRVSLSDVQIRGFMKDAFAFVSNEFKILKRKAKEGEAEKSYAEDYCRKWLGERVSFTKEYYNLDGEVSIFERPLRAKTMQGPRVAIAASEMIRPPTSIVVEFNTTDDITDEIIKHIFNRGEFKGIGQFANGQFGCFTYEIL